MEAIELSTLVVELQANEIEVVSGGQAAKSYCVYGNGTVGVHDFSAMVSRPLRPGESCG